MCCPDQSKLRPRNWKKANKNASDVAGRFRADFFKEKLKAERGRAMFTVNLPLCFYNLAKCSVIGHKFNLLLAERKCFSSWFLDIV